MSAVSKDDTLQRLAAFNAKLVAEAQQANDAARWRQFIATQPEPNWWIEQIDSEIAAKQ